MGGWGLFPSLMDVRLSPCTLHLYILSSIITHPSHPHPNTHNAHFHRGAALVYATNPSFLMNAFTPRELFQELPVLCVHTSLIPRTFLTGTLLNTSSPGTTGIIWYGDDTIWTFTGHISHVNKTNRFRSLLVWAMLKVFCFCFF